MFPNPEYPPQISSPLPEGKVGLWARIDEKGKVTFVSVVKRVDPLLDAAASLALSQWEFKPATKDGKPISVRMSFDSIFEAPSPHLVMTDVLRIGDPMVKPPRAIYAPDPTYTKAAMQAKIEGSVHLWLILDEHGVPQQVWIDKSLDPGLDQNAINAVKQWRFEPAREEGKPVAVKIDVAVNFRLH
jgi:TonB family protein